MTPRGKKTKSRINKNNQEYICISLQILLSLQKEDTIIVRGREYRRLTPGYVDKPSAYWVEGIGTSREFFLTLYLVPTDGGNLYVTPIMLACYENGECIFTKDDFHTTATSVQSAKEDTKGECELYDIVGRKVSKPGKGKVYISKGKKHVAF